MLLTFFFGCSHLTEWSTKSFIWRITSPDAVKSALSQWCWWMTVSFKSCWYDTFSPKTKTCLSLNMTSEHPPPSPKVCLWVRRGVKEIKWERDRWSGRSFPCPPLLFELFFHSSSSFCASFHSASDKALHSLPHSSTPPSSLHLPHTPRPHPLPPGSFV